MKTLTDKLADALRAALTHARESRSFPGCDDSAAVDALAEYDAERRATQSLADALRQTCAVLNAIARINPADLDRELVRGEYNVAMRALAEYDAADNMEAAPDTYGERA